MCLNYRKRIGQIAAEKEEMFNSLYRVYATLNSVKCADGLRDKHRKVIAGNSRKAFAEAVKLDKELKNYGKEE